MNAASKWSNRNVMTRHREPGNRGCGNRKFGHKLGVHEYFCSLYMPDSRVIYHISDDLENTSRGKPLPDRESRQYLFES